MGERDSSTATSVSAVPEISIEEARATLGELAARVGFGRERFVVTRYGEPAMALVSIRDLRALELLAASTEAVP